MPVKKKPVKQPRKVNKVQQNKKALLDALEQSLGVVTSACRAVGLDRTTFYNYYNKDKKFAKAADATNEIALDFAESQLHKQIQGGVPASTIFYLKTKGKKRGYVERQEHEHTGSLEHRVIKPNADD